VATIIQTQIRCAGCDRRLADLVNEVEAGQLIVELKCPRCGSSHLEIIRPPAPSGSLKHEAVADLSNRGEAGDGTLTGAHYRVPGPLARD
jgi:phage FluMu protein Com